VLRDESSRVVERASSPVAPVHHPFRRRQLNAPRRNVAVAITIESRSCVPMDGFTIAIECPLSTLQRKSARGSIAVAPVALALPDPIRLEHRRLHISRGCIRGRRGAASRNRAGAKIRITRAVLACVV